MGNEALRFNFPIALLGTLVVQTVGAIWWAATLTKDVNTMADNIKEMKVDRYTRAEAALAFRDLDNRNAETARRLGAIEDAIRDTRAPVYRYITPPRTRSIGEAQPAIEEPKRERGG